MPQGVKITDRVARELSSTAAQSANVQASQGAQAEVPLSSLGSVTEQENVSIASVYISLHEEAFRVVTFADAVRECVEDDAMSSVSEKGVVLEGHRNVLRLSYQLCPAAAPESPLAGCVTSRVCSLQWTDLLPLRMRPSFFIALRSCGLSIAGASVQLLRLASYRRRPCLLVVATTVVVLTLRLRLQHPSTRGFPGLLVSCPISVRCLFLSKKLRGWNPCV